ncbi:hypothetical protein [Nonomuraea dietziae]
MVFASSDQELPGGVGAHCGRAADRAWEPDHFASCGTWQEHPN